LPYDSYRPFQKLFTSQKAGSIYIRGSLGPQRARELDAEKPRRVYPYWLAATPKTLMV
jgi:hypothetical protein